MCPELHPVPGSGLHIPTAGLLPVVLGQPEHALASSPLLTLCHLTVPLWSRPLPVLRQALRQKHQEAQQACRPHNLPVLQAAQQRELEVGVWAWEEGGPTCALLTGLCGGIRVAWEPAWATGWGGPRGPDAPACCSLGGCA